MRDPFRLVVFDVGGVLVQAGRTWLDDAEHAGFTVSPQQLAELTERTKALPRRTTGEVDSARYAVMFAEASDGLFTVDDVRRISKASLRSEYPGVGAVFDALDAVDTPSALLCNVNDEEWSRYFPEPPGHTTDPEFPTVARARFRFASHLMGFAKPDPRAFAEVEHTTGIPGGAILFFDDRKENVDGARSHGWTAELIDHTGDTAQQLLFLLRLHAIIP